MVLVSSLYSHTFIACSFITKAARVKCKNRATGSLLAVLSGDNTVSLSASRGSVLSRVSGQARVGRDIALVQSLKAVSELTVWQLIRGLFIQVSFTISHFFRGTAKGTQSWYKSFYGWSVQIQER